MMDMSFANQALGAEYMVKNGQALEHKVYARAEEIDREIARLKLRRDGHRDRHADRRAEEVPRFVGTRHVERRWRATSMST